MHANLCTFFLAGVAGGLGGGVEVSPAPTGAAPEGFWETFTHLTDFSRSSQSGTCKQEGSELNLVSTQIQSNAAQNLLVYKLNQLIYPLLPYLTDTPPHSRAQVVGSTLSYQYTSTLTCSRGWIKPLLPYLTDTPPTHLLKRLREADLPDLPEDLLSLETDCLASPERHGDVLGPPRVQVAVGGGEGEPG